MPILLGTTVIALDTETTGVSPADGDRLIEVARVAVVDGALGAEWSSLVDPKRSIPWGATRVHGITDAMVAGAPSAAQAGRALRDACGDLLLVFHNAPFDLPFLLQLFREAGAPPFVNPIVDTLGLARGLFGTGNNALRALADTLKLPSETWHRALGDTRTTARLFVELAQRWEREKGIRSLLELAAVSQDVIRTTRRTDSRAPRFDPPRSDRRGPDEPPPPPRALDAPPVAREDAGTLFGPPALLEEPALMMTQTTPEVGQMAPEFRLKGPGGAFHTLSEHLGSPVVLVFYPLAFSRTCSHQLPELQTHLPAFEQAGAIVYGISVDSHYANLAFAKSLGVTFPLLSDWKHEASIAYGVMLPEVGYSQRATFVVGKDGRILWREISENSGEIPSPGRALASLSGS
jgi:DNA polymerase III epsilon subunit family exonuclease